MEWMSDVLNVLSVSILITAFMLVGGKRIISYIRTFRIQSAILAAVAGLYSVYHLVEQGRLDGILIIFLLTVVLKVFYIPGMLKKIASKVEYRVEKDFFINIPLSILICCGLVVLTWYVVARIQGLDPKSAGFLVQSVSVILIGLFFMISRKKAIGQITGFLVIENGMFLAAMLLTSGMPMIVEFGIFFDLLTAVLIMGVFVFKINETFEHIDINKLRNLRG